LSPRPAFRRTAHDTACCMAHKARWAKMPPFFATGFATCRSIS